MRHFRTFSFLSLYLVSLLALAVPEARASIQPIVSFPGLTAVGEQAPALSVPISITAAGTLTAPVVVTQGSTTRSDFTLLSAGTCTGTVSAGSACAVQVAFSPLYPGRRDGAVLLKSTDGHLLGSTLLAGSATGPLPTISPGKLDTVAGARTWVYAADGVPAVGAPIFLPQGLAVDTVGNLYLSDSNNSRIRRVDAASGLISTVVGNGTPGYNGDGLAGGATSVSQPAGLALDGAGNLYFADAGNHIIRRLDAVSGLVATVAGTPGMEGYAGDGSAAGAAKLTLPEGLAFDAAGDLLIADTGNNAIRQVDVTTGAIRTVAGKGVAGYAGDGGPATQGLLNSPWSVVVASDGSLLIADFGNDRVRKVSPAGVLSTIAGTGTRGFSGDGGPAMEAALSAPTALALDPAGDLYIADSGNNRVRLLSSGDGTLQTVVGNSGDSFTGDGGPANEASLYGPYALFLDANGNLFVADMFHNRVRRVSATALTLNYATIRVSKVSAPQAQGLKNIGNAPLTLLPPGLQNAALDSTTTTCLTAPVVPAQECNLGVEFAPTVIGTEVQGSVTLTSNAGESTPILTLQGQVLSVEPTTAALTASANPSLLGASLVLTTTVTSDDTSRSGNVTFLDGGTTLCTVPLASTGLATCTVSTLTLGSHTLTASYAGDANNASSTSPALVEVIKQAPQLVLSTSPNPSVVTGNVTLRLATSAATGTPTGTVSFLDGSAILGTATLDASGSASFATAQLAPGNHILSAQYAGDTADAAGTSNAVSQIVNQASTAVMVSTSNATQTVGVPVTLTAQVNSTNGPAPTGTVSFLDGSTVLETVALDAQGKASLSISSLSPGNHHLTVTFSGDTDSASSTSAALNETVAQIGTTVALSADANPLSAGATLHLVAAVNLAPDATAVGPLNGTVTFSEGAKLLGTDQLDATGHATLALPGLSVGAHTLTATYAGSTNYATATSAVLNESVTQTGTSTSLSASSPNSLAGKAVTFNVTVVSGTAIPTGAVVLRDNGAVLSQAALSANGTAAFTPAGFGPGLHTLVATYAGDVNYSTSISNPVTVSVTLAQPALSLNGPAAAVNVGFPATFSAALQSNGVAPTGTVSLQEGPATLAVQAVTSNGAITFSVNTLSLGMHALSVVYSGDVNNAAATSGTVTLSIQKAPTSTVLTGSANPVTTGDSLVLVAVVASDSVHPGGTVTFGDGSTVLGSASLDANGHASITTNTLTPGVHALSAMYSGDASHAASAAVPLNTRVVQPLSAVLNSTANPSISGRSVTFTAKLAPLTAQSLQPVGTVSFSDGGVILGTVALDANGTAALSTNALAVGIHTITVNFPGDSNFAATSATLTQAIASASTQIDLTMSANPSTYGSALTLTAAITSNGGTATGTVTFNDGAVSLGAAPLNNAGVAMLQVNTLSPGAHNLIASYAGDGRASASVSAPVAVAVKQITTLALSSSSNPLFTLSGVQFTVAILNAGAATATGAVIFTDGTSTLGTVAIDASGRATISVPQLAAGVHTIAATYAGDGSNFGSATGVPLSETVQRRSTGTSLTSSSLDPTDPQQATLIAVVRANSTSTMPSGTVSFRSGGTLLGTSQVDATGVATFTIELEVKQESVTASYGGDVSFAGSDSDTTTITAGAATQFTLQVNPSAVSLQSKQHTTVVLTLQSVKGFNDMMKLGCLGLPYAATCTFSSPQTRLDANGSATVQLTIDTGNPLGAGTQVSRHEQGGPRVLVCFLPAGLIFGLAYRQRRRRSLLRLLTIFCALALAIGASGCAGLQINGTPAGSYTFKVTASGMGTGATQSQTTSMTVTQ